MSDELKVLTPEGEISKLVTTLGIQVPEIRKWELMEEYDFVKAKHSQNHEFSTDLLLKCYFMADQLSKNPAFGEFTNGCAEKLREKCREEIMSRFSFT